MPLARSATRLRQKARRVRCRNTRRRHLEALKRLPLRGVSVGLSRLLVSRVLQGLACAKRCAGHSETLAASECLSWLLEQACPEVSGVGRAIRARGL